MDYSNKYGLGWVLNNGLCGVYFNDSSKAILEPNQLYFEYIERKNNTTQSSSSASSSSSSSTTSSSSSTSSNNQTIIRTRYAINNYPSSLTKKVTLLKHFMNYLVVPAGATSSNSNKDQIPQPTVTNVAAPPAAAAAVTGATATAATVVPSLSELLASPYYDGEGGLIYVKKWLRTKHAIFFRLSNRVVQVIFLDHTELVLSSQFNSVTYTDKTRNRMTYPLDQTCLATTTTATSSSSSNSTTHNLIMERPDLTKRMKYTKDILSHLLNRQQQQQQQTQTQANQSNPTAATLTK